MVTKCTTRCSTTGRRRRVSRDGGRDEARVSNPSFCLAEKGLLAGRAIGGGARSSSLIMRACAARSGVTGAGEPAHPRAQGRFQVVSSAPRPACSHRTARSSPGRNQRDELPAGALVGLPVSAGTIEGQARVILDIGRGRTRSGLHPGHRLHRPQLDAPIRRDQRPRDGGWAA